ncbi:MAG: hypothetical protein ACHP84_08085 [Caulobacterales bacterium]
MREFLIDSAPRWGAGLATGSNVSPRWFAVFGVALALAFGMPDASSAAPPHIFAGTWDTTYNTMTLRQTNAHVEGDYAFDDGHIVGDQRGRVLTGYWTQSTAGQSCATSRMGGQYWGAVVFTLSPDGKSFRGRWGYCGGRPTRAWSGTLRAAAMPTRASTPTPCHGNSASYVELEAPVCSGPPGTVLTLYVSRPGLKAALMQAAFVAGPGNEPLSTAAKETTPGITSSFTAPLVVASGTGRSLYDTYTVAVPEGACYSGPGRTWYFDLKVLGSGDVDYVGVVC